MATPLHIDVGLSVLYVMNLHSSIFTHPHLGVRGLRRRGIVAFIA